LDACTLIILHQMYMFPCKIKNYKQFGKYHKMTPFTIVTIGGIQKNVNFVIVKCKSAIVFYMILFSDVSRNK